METKIGIRLPNVLGQNRIHFLNWVNPKLLSQKICQIFRKISLRLLADPFLFGKKKRMLSSLSLKMTSCLQQQGITRRKKTTAFHSALSQKNRNIKSKKIMTKAYLHSRSPKAPTSFAHELINSLYFTNITNEIFKISKHAPLQKL